MRLTNVRGLDLNVFDFDYDLTWFAFFLTPDGQVLGRFGGRDADTPGKYHSLKGLRYSLEQALSRYRETPWPVVKPAPPRRVDDYPGIARFTRQACVHCHHVYELRREAMQQAGTWKTDEVWVYPEPQNVGLEMDTDQGDSILTVRPESAAAEAGLRAGDVLRSLGAERVRSIADLQYALHRSPVAGKVAAHWKRGDRSMHGEIILGRGWRHTDVSWRWSLKSLSPSPGLHGDDLTAEERRERGLSPRGLALRQGNYLSTTASQAGVRFNDVIVGIDGRPLEMTARQFEAFIRLNYKVGDVVNLDLLRGRERLTLSLKLPK